MKLFNVDYYVLGEGWDGFQLNRYTTNADDEDDAIKETISYLVDTGHSGHTCWILNVTQIIARPFEIGSVVHG